MTDPLDPSLFLESEDFYIKEFEYILAKIVCCYKLMRNKGDMVPNNEENIRDALYNGYLNKNEVRNRIGLNYNIDCEPAEYRNGLCSGFVDLKIFSSNSLTDTSAYYVIECKRLDNQNCNGTTGLNAEYIRNGIMRFVNGKYSTNKYLNGMIGFVVEQMDISCNISNINKLLKNHFSNAHTVSDLSPVEFINDFEYQYYSIHRKSKNSKIKLYHLMFDFSAIIKKNGGEE
jgi:hypothetical protein